MKTQIDKLWQEVNSLKEMQALQTGECSCGLSKKNHPMYCF